MRSLISAGFVGLLFGAGLGISGMTQADKVIGFLNPVGGWDPSLAFVMVGAIAVHVVLFRLILRRPSPLFSKRFFVPTRQDIDGKLIGGAALFGIGWALGGYCPGPGMVSVASGSLNPLAFMLALSAGIVGYQDFTSPIPSAEGEATVSSK